MSRVLLTSLIAAGLVTMGSGVVMTAEESRAARATSAPESQSVSGDAAVVEKKLREILKNQEQILANQATILQKFDAVMEELRIIKVRATLRGS